MLQENMLLHTGPLTVETCIQTIRLLGNQLEIYTCTSSFVEGVAVMLLALEWTIANQPDYSLTICTNIQSLPKTNECQ